MKKFLPYLLAIIGFSLLIWLLLRGTSEKHFDNRITLNTRDKIPYGAFVAYNDLHYLFPLASISVNRREPGYWDSLNSYDEQQVLMIVSPQVYADEFDMKKLIHFIEKGNSVFISTAILSQDAKDIMGCNTGDPYEINFNPPTNHYSDSFSVSLLHPPFNDTLEYICPGRRFESYFFRYDRNTSSALGNGIYEMPDLIHLQAGRGNLYIHLTPLAFSNYFLLHKQNIKYYEQLLSVLPKDAR